MDEAYSVRPTHDSGIVVSGWLSDAPGTGCCLLKLTGEGTLSWARTYTPDGCRTGTGVALETPDHGFVVYASVKPDSNPEDVAAYLVRTDSVGDTLWTARCRPDWGELTGLKNVSLDPDGGYTICAWTEIWGDTNYIGTFLARFDSSGRVAWDTVVLQGSQLEVSYWIRCVQVLSDSGFILTGERIEHGVGASIALYRLGPRCESLWCRGYDGLDPDELDLGTWVVQTRDGGYAIFGDADYAFAYLIKTDSLGLVYSAVEEPRRVEPVNARVEASPNPARGAVGLSWMVPAAGRVDLKVYNTAGQLVKVLAQGEAKRGRYSATWAGTDQEGRRLAAGVYHVTFDNGEKRISRKVVLTK